MDTRPGHMNPRVHNPRRDEKGENKGKGRAKGPKL